MKVMKNVLVAAVLVVAYSTSALAGTVFVPKMGKCSGSADHSATDARQVAETLNSWESANPEFRIVATAVQSSYHSHIDGIWVTYEKKSSPSSSTAPVSTNSVAPVAKAHDEKRHVDIADQDDNGAPGGFSLIKVTKKQAAFLQKKGIKLHHSGNVLDRKYSADMEPILMADGCWDPTTLSPIEPSKMPDVFWLAIRTGDDAD